MRTLNERSVNGIFDSLLDSVKDLVALICGGYNGNLVWGDSEIAVTRAS